MDAADNAHAKALDAAADALLTRSSEARAAVAELIEAVKPIVDRAEEDGSNVLQSWPCEFERIRAALDNIGSAS